MKITVISYSLTGNNEALAAGVASEFSAEHIRITEPGPRTNGTIALDMLFGRTPKVNPTLNDARDKDMVVFVGPVWMGQVATPLRACLKQLKTSLNQYAFISISGGADGPNPKLARELTKRVGKPPVAVVDQHIAALLPSEPKPTREDTSAYRVTDQDVVVLTNKVVTTLREAMAK
jgi:multimeric flavodoxin WrbA